MSNKIEYLPLGSTVLLSGNFQKLVIVGRGLNVKKEDETYFFDYAAVLYPNGLTGDEIVYFNHESIAKVYSHGYVDDDNDVLVDAINRYIEETPHLKRADLSKW